MTNDEWAEERGSVEECAFWELGPAEELLVLRDTGAEPVYDLEERTARFGERIIFFSKKIPWGPVNNRLVAQLVGAGTSIGANYCEADDGVSKADFKHRIGTCRKEARETKFFHGGGFGARVQSRSARTLERSPRYSSYFQPNLA